MAAMGKTWQVWAWAGVAGLVAIFGLMLLPRSPVRLAEDAGEVAMQAADWEPVGISKLEGGVASELLREEAMMRDPAPLFLPSPWSASGDALSLQSTRDPGMSFRGYEAKWMFDENQLALQMTAPVTVPARPAEAFALDRPKRPFQGFGQMESPVAPLQERRAFMTVTSAADGEVMLSLKLEDAAPPVADAWDPLEFMLAVSPSGVTRPPVLVESSSVAAVDSYFQEYLVGALRMGERLEPGFYRVAIGP